MRLIDADKLKVYLQEYLHYGHAIPWVDEQPTAYSVDKVIEELEKIEQHCLDMSDWQGQSAICDAIEIVKQGGASDDVCEWKSVRDGQFIKNPHTKRVFSNEPSMQNVYCNTCGKKIKIVGD